MNADRGRRAANPDKPRVVTIQVLISEDERDEIRTLAASSPNKDEQTASGWVYAAIRGRLARERRKKR
jgi:hypothetical protein